jgi:hypothetical protein
LAIPRCDVDDVDSAPALGSPPARHEPLGVQASADHERRDDDAPEDDRVEQL